MTKQLSFASVKLKDLRAVVNLYPNKDTTVFDKWSSFAYTISPTEETFLLELIF